MVEQKSKLIFLVFFCLFPAFSFSQLFDKKWETMVLKSPDEWFKTENAKAVAENVLLYQRNIGGWTKNIPVYKVLSQSEKEKLLELKTSTEDCTLDNGATYL